MRHAVTLNQVKRITRARVCATCRCRTPGMDDASTDRMRPCEAGCSLFKSLPVLTEAARNLDPLVGHRPRMLRRLVHRHDAVNPTGGGRVVELLEELFD